MYYDTQQGSLASMAKCAQFESKNEIKDQETDTN